MTNKTAARFLREQFLAKLPEIETAHTESQHFYKYNGNVYPSVSAPLSFWKKAELSDWALRQQREYVLEHWKEFDSISVYQHIEGMQNRADSIRDAAARTGSAVHEARERSVNYYLEYGEWNKFDSFVTKENPAEVMNGIRCWFDFVTKESYEPILCETRLVDTELGVGGSLDDIGFIGNKLVLIDVKTSNNVDHYTYWLQVSKYWSMFRKHVGWKKELKPWLLHLPKKPGASYTLTEIKDPSRWAKQYDELFKLWQSKDNYKPAKLEAIKI